MASMRAIKRRRESVQSTGQITKAMKLVATVKLQKARGAAEANKPYLNMLYNTICSIFARTGASSNKYFITREEGKKLVIVISGNRGLAGGYNSNIVKAVDALGLEKDDTVIYGIGRKGIEGLSRRGYVIEKDYSDVINDPLYNDAISISKEILEKYDAGEIEALYIAYTEFKNTVVHDPKVIKLLPLDEDDFIVTDKDDKVDKTAIMNFEPSEHAVLDMIVPKYLTNIIYGSFLAAIASENAARMQAMDSATSNAEDMIQKLGLQYNRARQGSITQELTEIIAGSEAIS